MTVNRFIRNLLNLKEMAVTHFELDVRHRILNLWVKPYKNGCRCPECPYRLYRPVRISEYSLCLSGDLDPGERGGAGLFRDGQADLRRA